MRPIGDRLVIATHNAGKLREMAALVEALGVAIAVNAGAALVYSTRVLDAYAAAAPRSGQ